MAKGRKPTWKILDRGNVPDPAPNHVQFACLNCLAEAELPVVGLPIAQIDQGIVFDPGERGLPKVIQCRRCRKTYRWGE